MMKTSLQNINKYEMHVNLGISVSLMCTSPLNVGPLYQSIFYAFSLMQLSFLRRSAYSFKTRQYTMQMSVECQLYYKWDQP